MKVELLGEVLTKPCVNVMHVRVNPFSASAIPDGTLQDAADDIAAAWIAHVVPGLSSSYAFTNCRVTDLGDFTGHQRVSTNAVTQGSQTSHLLPPASAMVISIVSTLRSRSGRGRQFLGGIPADALDVDGDFTTTYHDNLATAWNAFKDQIQTEGDLVVGVAGWPPPAPANPGPGHPPANWDGIFSDYVSFTISDAIRQQRRREVQS